MSGILRTLFQESFRVHSRSFQTLERMQRGREWLTLYLPGDQTERTSRLLYLDSGRTYILLEEPSPRPEEPPQPGGEAFFLGLAAGVQAGLRCVVEGQHKWDGTQALQLRWPHAVYHLQRRSHFRVPVGTNEVVALELQRRGGRSVRAECLDLSISGMRLQIAAGEATPFAVNDWIERVSFRVSAQAVTCSALVRFVQPLRARTQQPPARVLGLQFQQLQPRQEVHLQRYVHQRDRDLVLDSRL